MTDIGDKIAAPLEFERVAHSLHAGFRVDWLEGNNGRGVEYDLTAGAGVGSPFMTLTVSFPDGTRVSEVANVAPMVTRMVTRIIAEHDGSPEPAPDPENPAYTIKKLEDALMLTGKSRDLWQRRALGQDPEWSAR